MVEHKSSPASSPLHARTAVILPAKTAGATTGVKRPVAKPSSGNGSTPFWFGLTLSAAWIVGVVMVIAKSGPAHTFGGLPLVNWAIGVSAVVSPVALVWMVTAYLQRATDIQAIAEPLRRQLSLITGESGAADARIRRFNQAIREQLDLLRSAQAMTKDDLTAIMDRIRQSRSELEQFENASLDQVTEIQEIIHRNMQHVEQMMDDKFTMMRVLDDRLLQNSSTISRQTETMRDQVASMLKEVEENGQHVSEALNRAMQDSRKLSDTSRSQEASLLTAAENAADTLNTVSGKIDYTVAHFLERAGSAREEAERLASALDTQTRSLDEFSNILPARAGEAESVLRGVADRLYASEQLACEQAIHLSDKLSQQVDNLNGFMDRFTTRIAGIDGGLQQRHQALDLIATRVDSSTDAFVNIWENSVTSMSKQTDSTLQRLSIMNDETRRNADSVATQLAATTGIYEETVTRMRTLSVESHAELKEMTQDIAAHLSQFEALREASQKVGEEVQTRAASAVQNLSDVLERLTATREATRSVGDTLVHDLTQAVDQNERLITRLHEATQQGLHTMSVAASSLGQQEGAMVAKTHTAGAMLQEATLQLQQQAQAAEKGLREQALGLMALLNETQNQMNSTDQKLQGFANRTIPPIQQVLQHIDSSSELGLQSMARYGAGLQTQLEHLQDFNGRVGGMSQDIGRVTGDTLIQIENLNNRFVAARKTQEETASQTLEQFANLADRLQREVVGLDGQTSQAVETLQQAAARVGEQSYQMLQNAQNAGAQMQSLTNALQNETTQIRSVLQKQADDLGADLNRTEAQFSTISDALKQRTETAHALLDRVATHYSDMTHTTSQDLEDRTARLEQITGQAQGKVETLNQALTQQLNLINDGSAQMETRAAQLTAHNSKAVQQLSALNEKLAITHEATNSTSQQALSRIEECTTAFLRQSNSLSEAAQNSVTLIQKAGVAFGDQAGKLNDSSHQMDQHIRQMTATTTVLADQSTQIRTHMEQQSQRLAAQLTEAIKQLEACDNKLQQSVMSATTGVDQIESRYATLTQNASTKLSDSQQTLQTTADKAETTLTTLGASITQQAATLSVLCEQMGEQQNVMSVANEAQRAQMVDMFDKMGAAHSQASDVAERTITRLTEALNQIQRSLGSLSDQSQTSVGNVRAASEGFAEQSGVLLQNAQAAEQQARTVLSVTEALQNQAKQLRETLHGESERTSEVLGHLLGKISTGGSEIRELGANTEIVLTSLQNGLTQQTSLLSGNMQQISDRQRSLTVALDAQRDVINGLLNRFALAQDETAATAERSTVRLTDSAQKIERQIETLDTRTQSAISTLQTATSSFANESQNLHIHAQEAEQQARATASSMGSLQEQARKMSEALQGESARTNEALNNLFNKLSTSSVKLQDIGSSSEITLTNIHGRIEEQSVDLKDSLQPIIERQLALTAALAEQRDMVNGMIREIASAQDETAATTERTVARLSDSAQQVSKQIETMGSQAQTTLTLIHAASTGFSDEANALGLHAQQAEQQMRAVLSVTTGLQDQAKHLRESLQGETARVIDQMTDVIAQLDSTNTKMKQQSSAAIHTMDQTTLQFTATARSSGDALQKQVDVLAQTAEQAEARMGNVGEKIRGHLKLVSDVGEQTEQQAHQLANSAEYATSRLVTLRDTLADSDKNCGMSLAQASARIDEVKAALQSEVTRLSDMSHDAVQQVVAASQTLATQSDVLRSNLSMSESALNEAASLVRDESVQVPATLNRSAAQIETIVQLLKNQAAEADSTLVGTADRFISVTTTARESIVNEMHRVSSVADNADEVLRHFSKIFTEQVETMQQNTVLLSNEQKDLVESAHQNIAQLSSTSDRLAQLRRDATGTAEKLVTAFDILDQRATTSSERLEQVGEIVVKQVDALCEATQRAEGQMTGASTSFREQMERIRGGVQEQIDDINRGLMQITAQLERTGSTLRSTTVGSVADVEHIAQRYDQSSKETSAKFVEKTEQMRCATEDVGQMLSGFSSQIDKLLGNLSTAGEGIKKNEGDLIEQMQVALSHLASVTDGLEIGRTLTSRISEEAVERLSTASDAIQKEMQNLSSGSQTAAGIMRGLGQIYGDQAQAMSKGVVEAHYQVQDMNKSIEDMQQRTDRMRLALKLQGEDLMDSLQQILQQLSSTGDALGSTVDQVLREQAEQNLEKMG